MTATVPTLTPTVSRSTEPLSQWVLKQADRYLWLGSDRGLLIARVLGDLSAQLRAVESPGAAPLTVEEALDRIEALRYEEEE